MYNSCNVCIVACMILKLTYTFDFQLLKQEVSVFILDKKSKEFEKMPKRNRDSLFDTFKSGPVQLARLRHPRLLTVDHPLDESKYEHTYVHTACSRVCMQTICIQRQALKCMGVHYDYKYIHMFVLTYM